MSSLNDINASLRAKERSKDELLKGVNSEIKKAKNVSTANNATALGTKVGDTVAGVVSKDQLSSISNGGSTAGQLVDAGSSDFTFGGGGLPQVDIDHTGAFEAGLDSDGEIEVTVPASKDSKAGNVLSTDITGFAPPVESIEIVALGGAAVDQLTTAIGTSTERKVELIESIAATAAETTKQPGGIPSSFTEQVNAIKLKIENPFADANTLDYFQKSLLYNSHAKYNGAFAAVHGYRLPKSAGWTNSIMLHILPADKLDKQVAGSMRVWSNMPGLRGWEGQYFQCWVSEFPNSEPITGLFGRPLVWLSQQPNPYAWSWTHDDEFYSRQGVGSDQQGTKIWGIPQDMGNLYINMAIIGQPFGPFTINDGPDAPFTINDYTHGWSNRIGHIEGYLPELIDTPDESGIDSATTDLLTGISAVEELGNAAALGAAAAAGSLTSIGSDISVGGIVSSITDGIGNLAGGIGGIIDDIVEETGDFLDNILPDIDTGFGGVQDLFEDITGSVGNLLTSALPGVNLPKDILSSVINDVLTGGDVNIGKAAKKLLGADESLSPEMRNIISDIDDDTIENQKDLQSKIEKKAKASGIPQDEIDKVNSNLADGGSISTALDSIDTTISGSIVAKVGDFYTEDTDLADLVKYYLGAETENFQHVDSKEELGLEFVLKTRETSEVVIHASDTYTNANIGSEEIHLRHNEAGHDGIQYHYVIRRDGRLQRGKPLDTPGDASAINGHKQNCIDICLVGGINVPTESPEPSLNLSASSYTQTQMKTLESFLEVFYRMVPGGQVLGHSDIDPESPDPYFDVIAYVENLFGKKSVYENPLADASVSLADLVTKKPV